MDENHLLSPAGELVPPARARIAQATHVGRIRAQNDLHKSETEPGKTGGCSPRQVQGSTEQIQGRGEEA